MTAGPYSIGSSLWAGLSKVIEEAGEVSQVAGKLIANNGEAAHWDGSNLRHRIGEETADCYAAIEFFVSLNGLDSAEWRARVAAKVEQYRKWHTEQCGVSSPPSATAHPLAIPATLTREEARKMLATLGLGPLWLSIPREALSASERNIEIADGNESCAHLRERFRVEAAILRAYVAHIESRSAAGEKG